jgi:hypothetical protein
MKSKFYVRLNKNLGPKFILKYPVVVNVKTCSTTWRYEDKFIIKKAMDY